MFQLLFMKKKIHTTSPEILLRLIILNALEPFKMNGFINPISDVAKVFWGCISKEYEMGKNFRVLKIVFKACYASGYIQSALHSVLRP